MPIWGYIYCGIFVCSCGFSLFDKDRLKRSYQPAGEILDCLCAFLIFLIGFNILEFENSAVISTLCFVYTMAWSYHAHRHYLDYDKFKSDIHKWTIEEHEKLVSELLDIQNSAMEEDEEIALEFGDEFKREYDFEKTEKVAHYLYIGAIVVLVVILLPYFYVYLKSVGAIGS